jgi:DNA-binding response OmpR family regulator
MRILLVEDEKKIANFIAKGLREEQYAVDVAYSGEGALTDIAVYDYDLIITDIMMPGMNGFELIKKLRSSQNKTPILILTAKDKVDDKIFGLDSGADDYLTKPFAFAELLARIRALQRRPNTLLEKLEIADLVLEPSTHNVKRGAKKINLTPKEFSLLEFMLRNKGRVVTRTTLIEHVWDMHFDSDTNLVDVFISYLRKKIEPKGTSQLIHSVRGVGYILEERNISED